jgi:predicted transposase YdaD
MSVIWKIKRKIRREGLLNFIAALIALPFTVGRRRKYKAMLALPTPKERFDEIYRSNFW